MPERSIKKLLLGGLLFELVVFTLLVLLGKWHALVGPLVAMVNLGTMYLYHKQQGNIK